MTQPEIEPWSHRPLVNTLLIRPLAWLYIIISCLNFWDEACWFLSLRFFRLLSSSLLLFPQHFGWYVLRPSSGVCRTREPSRNFKLRPLLKPKGVVCSDFISHNRVQVSSIPVLLLACSEDWTCNLQMIVSLEAQGTNAYNRYAMCWFQ